MIGHARAGSTARRWEIALACAGALQAALATTVPSDEGLVVTVAEGFTAPDLAGLGAAPTTAPLPFFAVGQNVRGYADILARMTREGHEVEGHTWNHPHLPQLTEAQVTAQIVDSTRAIEAATGQRVTVFRPPYGEFTPQVLAAAGKAAILWDVDTLDWQGPADDVLIARAVEQPRAGSIVLQHDTQAVTARTVGAVVDGLLDRGFQLVTVRQLFRGDLPASGSWRRAP